MKKDEYYLGLDMGTNSIGWAVTDKNYNLIKAKGKELWGVHEFEEAQTSVERRTHRTSRRRHQRELVRIGILKSYFEEAINKVDPNFYARLDNSKYHFEDKDEAVRSYNGIFNDKDYDDKAYFAEYKTIFHLRKELIQNPDKHDVRLIYLALLNMFKHRGHFLNNGLSIDEDVDNRSFSEVYQEFANEVNELYDLGIIVTVPGKELEEILSDRKLSRRRKSESMAKLMNVDLKNKKVMPYINAICGLKVAAKSLFEDLELEDDKKVDIAFADYDFEEKKMELAESLDDSQFRIVELMKELNDKGSLAGIMKGYSYLSEARVAEYEKHHKDLTLLKKVMKVYSSKEVYDSFFRDYGEGSYSAYVGSTNAGIKQRRSMNGRKRDDLYKNIRKILKGHEDDERVVYILEEMDMESFLPKQLTASNGIIPNQLHLKEMKKILSNAEKYLEFLKDKDESGYTVSERICQLFSFQIPYYIGPVTENSKKNGGNGWVIRNEAGMVFPWNFEEKIDVVATQEKFISRMVRRCTYLNGETALPKMSMEYQSYCVLNELNNLKVDGEKISVQLKQDIYNDLFKKNSKVTKKKLVSYLIFRGAIEEESQISGVDIAINNTLSTYAKFASIIGDKIETDEGRNMVEQIVFWSTVFGDSKKVLKRKLSEEYSSELSNEQIKKIIGYKFKDWGRLSKEFLELQGCNKADGEAKSLIRMMWDENLNLIELINSDLFTYKDALVEKTQTAIKTLYDIEAEDLDEYYFSAPVKRMVWRTILIIKEITKVLGTPPSRLFIEMTRKEEKDKKRTISRKQKFLDLYKNIKSEDVNWKDVIENAEENGTIRSKKMYLYLTQRGRCMYSGKEINLNDLFNDNLYDIDHIYPRHFVKDDNIDNNLVLVSKTYNAHKSDTYPIEENVYSSQRHNWKNLFEAGFINEEKYRRLTGRYPFTEEQKAGFIARQLVETSQGTKGVADILKQIMPSDTKLVYSKASNVSEFRNSRKLYKSRLINDFHHAHDAYLNIVVGNVYYTKFTQNPLNFIKKEYASDKEKFKYNLGKMFDWNVERNGEVAWIASEKDGETGTIVTIKKTLAKNTPLFTRYSFEGHGGIANETLYSAEKASGEGYIPFKSTDNKLKDVKKYGGFTSVSTAYFFLVEHDVKKKRIRTIETVPIYLKEKIEKNSDELLNYCKDVLGLINPSIRVSKIKIQSLVRINGYLCYLTGKTGKQLVVRNAINLCLKPEWVLYIKKLEKYSEKNIIEDTITQDENIRLYDELIEKHTIGIYSKRPNAIGAKLQAKSERFVDLSIEEQIKTLVQLLKMTSILGSDADLTIIGESKNTGKMLIPKKISELQECKIINQSITGVYKSPDIDLLNV